MSGPSAALRRGARSDATARGVLALAAAAGAAALDLALPTSCSGCGRRPGALCDDCRRALRPSPGLARPAGALPGLPPVAAAGVYRGVLRGVLLAHKDGATGLAGPLGEVLAEVVVAAVGVGVPVLLVPAPSSRASVRDRGHDHALRLAQAAARDLRRRGCDARAVGALRQRAAVRDQGSLSAAARSRNLRGAVAVGRAARLRAAGRERRELVLVDDVCATGATLAECARALEAAGAPPRLAVVAAATVLRSPPAGSDPPSSPRRPLPGGPPLPTGRRED